MFRTETSEEPQEHLMQVEFNRLSNNSYQEKL